MSTKKQIGRIPVSKGEYVAGQTYNRLNQVTMYGSTYQSRVDGNTSAPAIMDSNGNVQHTSTDLWLVIADGREAYNAGEKLSCFSLQENDEFLAVETDAEGKILSSTNADGSHYIHNAKSETIPTEFSHIEDPEGRLEITRDAEGKIISFRDKEGVLHEEKIAANHISLTDDAAKEVNEAFKSAGIKMENFSDWSNADKLYISIPRYAKLNIISNVLPSAKSGIGIKGVTSDIPCNVEFFDMNGNYFKKPILISAQGDSSTAYDKKNFAIDFFVNEEERDTEGDTFPIKFGDWVSQDSFHLKAYYTDFFRGVGAVGYTLADEVCKTRKLNDDRPYKNGFTSNYVSPTDDMSENLKENLDTGAKCFPMGFPVIVYNNGDFYGVYSWQMKKHRDNYWMDKKTAEHIHLDGTINGQTLFGGNVDWWNFEIRNPKNLYKSNGEKYNGDYPSEIIGTENEAFVSSNKDMIKCAQVKEYIKKLSGFIPELKEAVKNGKNENEIREIFDSHFITSHIIDYLLISNILGNGDGFSKNWQWTTWNGNRWGVNLYDLDGIFGAWHLGNLIFEPTSSWIGNDMDIPTGWIIKYYEQELKARYAELRQCKVFDASHIVSLLKDWCNRIGFKNYELEFSKWAESPCNRSSLINSDYWTLQSNYYYGEWDNLSTYPKGSTRVRNHKVYRSLVDNNLNNDPDIDDGTHWENITYNPQKQYTVGDICGYGKVQFYPFRCITNCSGTAPLSGFYSKYPNELGHYDNIYRVYNWLEKRISYMDSILVYNK